jgi:hypothetical protein
MYPLETYLQLEGEKQDHQTQHIHPHHRQQPNEEVQHYISVQ